MNSIVFDLISKKRQDMSNNAKSNTVSKGDNNIDLLSGLLEIQTKQQQDIFQGRDKEVKDETSKMPDDRIRDHLITMLIAGHETTANALTWTYYLLAQHPEVEKKVFEEIDSVLRDKSRKKKQKSIEMLQQMMFLN